MQGVCFESFADVLLSDFLEGASAVDVDQERDTKDQDGGEARLDVDGMEEEAGESLEDDVESGHDEQARLDKGGEVLEFAVPIGVTRVGRLVSDADGKKSDDGGNKVEAGMQGFREDAEASGAPDEKVFRPRRSTAEPTLRRAARLFSSMTR